MAALLVLAGIVVATPAAGLAAQEATPILDNGSDDGFGSAVSSFMQASAAETEGRVDNGMWAAGLNRAEATDRPGMVHARADVLERRLDRLEQERADLLNDTDGEITVGDRAKAARLAARAAALRAAINETEAAAATVGVDLSRLDVLRTQAKNLTGPEVAALATNLTGDPGSGPPDDVGRDSGSDGVEDRSGGADDGDPGQSGNANDSDASADGSGQGPPDDAPSSEE